MHRVCLLFASFLTHQQRDVYSGVSIGKTTELRGMKLILFVKQNYALCSRFWCYRPGPIWPRVIPASREINLGLVRRQVTTYSVIGFSKKIDETHLMTGFFFSENSSNRGTNGPTGRYSISSSWHSVGGLVHGCGSKWQSVWGLVWRIRFLLVLEGVTRSRCDTCLEWILIMAPIHMTSGATNIFFQTLVTKFLSRTTDERRFWGQMSSHRPFLKTAVTQMGCYKIARVRAAIMALTFPRIH
jgi:hypothetical protein